MPKHEKFKSVMNKTIKKLIKRFTSGHFVIIMKNVGWLYSETILHYILGFFVGLLVARYLGPEQFGFLNYATAFLGLFAVLTHLGLEKIVIRNLTKEPEQKDKILGTTFFLKVLGGIGTFLLAVGLIFLLRPGEKQIRLFVAILAFGTVFQAFSAIDYWFQSKIQSRYSVWAKNAAYIIVSLVRVLLIIKRAPLIAFVCVILAESVLAAIGLAVVYQIKGYSLRAWRCTFTYAKSLLAESWPLMLTVISISVYQNIDKVMLGQMIGSEAVGIYSAAVKVGMIWLLIPAAFTFSFFPLIVKGKQINEDLYYARIRKLFNIVAAIGLPIAIVLMFFSSPLVIFLYGSSYARAGLVLGIYVWGSLFASFGGAAEAWIIAEGRTKFALMTKIGGLIINVSLNWLLIPLYREVGAAVATLFAHIATDYLFFLIYSPSRKVGYLMTKALAFNILFDLKDKVRE